MSLDLLLLTTISLIAIMLGRLRMSVPQALSLYRDFGETIFGRKQKRALGGINIFAARYSYKNVESVIKSTVQKHCKEHKSAVTSCDEDTLRWTDMTGLRVDNNWNICQTYVDSEIVSTRANYFPRVCLTARENGKNCQPFHLRTNRPALLLSIGTGIMNACPFAENDGDSSNQNRSSMRQKLAIGGHVLMRYTESESIHRSIRDVFRKGDKGWYKRLNVDEGLGEMKLGDWRAGNWTDENGDERKHSGGATLTTMETAVKKYVTRDRLNKKDGTELKLLPKTMVDHTAQRLVRQKTKREGLAKSGYPEDQDKWEKHRGKWLTGQHDSSWKIDTGDEPFCRS